MFIWLHFIIYNAWAIKKESDRNNWKREIWLYILNYQYDLNHWYVNKMDQKMLLESDRI